MKTIAQYETDVTIACSKRDAARKHQSALVALVTAFEQLSAATESASFTDVERQGLTSIEVAISTPWISALKSLRLANEEVDRLDSEVVDLEATFNCACTEAA